MAVLTELGEDTGSVTLYYQISNLPTKQAIGDDTALNELYIPSSTAITPFGNGVYSISGTVKNSSLSFVARTVIAADRNTGIIYDKVVSDPVTGAFTLKVPNTQCIVYCIPEVADGVNAEIYDRITPVASI